MGDCIGHINYVEKIGVVLQDVDADKSIALFFVSIELRIKRDTFNMILQPIHGVIDLVMPRKVVKDLNVLENLRTLSSVFKIIVAKRNGCFRHHEPDDVVSIRILCSSTSLEEQKEIVSILQPSFDIVGRSVIKECQFRNGVPWHDEDFLRINGLNVAVSAIDLRSFSHDQITDIMQILIELRIFFYFMSSKRLIVYGDGEALVQLRLCLIPLDVHLPIGKKQGSTQHTFRKYEVMDNGKMRFKVSVDRIGSFTTIPVQICISSLQEDIDNDCLASHEIVKFLQNQLQADKFHIDWIENEGEDEKCLCFEIGIEHEASLPILIDSGQQLVTINYCGPRSKSIQTGFVNKPCETKFEHWQTVVRNKSQKNANRKNHLAFEKQMRGSATRYHALRTTSAEDAMTRMSIVIANEECPFLFSDKHKITDLRMIFRLDDNIANKWINKTEMSNFEWEEQNFTDSDDLNKNKLKYRITQLLLREGCEYKIARPIMKNDRWTMVYADELILRTFEHCYVTVVCPPGIKHSQIVYGNLNYVCISSLTAKKAEETKGPKPAANCSFFQQVYTSTAADDPKGDDEGEYRSNNTVIDSPSQVPDAFPSPNIDEEPQKEMAMDLDEKLEKHQQDARPPHDQQNLPDAEMHPGGHEPQTPFICDEKTHQSLHFPEPLNQSNQRLQQKEHKSLAHQRPCCSNDSDDSHKGKNIGKADDKCKDDVGSNKENVPLFNSKSDSQSTGLNCPSTKETTAAISSKKEGQGKPSVNQDVATVSVATSNVDSLFTHKERLAKAFQKNAKYSQVQHFQIHSDNDEDDVQIMDYKSAPQSDFTAERCKIILECSKILTKVPHADKYILLCQDAIQTWPLLFLNENHEMLKQAGACYLSHFAATMCYAMTALRILSYAPWTEDHMKGHIREIALCAVAKGWTYKTPKISVTGQRVTMAEICVAIATYENIDIFPVGPVSDLDQTIIEVTNDLFPQHVEEFYPEFIFQCFCCSASIKKNVSVFDAKIDDVYKEEAMDLTKIYSSLVPRAALEKEGISHQHDCCDHGHITVQQNTSGLILTALFAHPNCTSLPSIESCLPLLDQCVHVGESEISSTTNQAPPKTLYCKSLIIVALGGSPNSNHFFLIEEVKQTKFRVYDNLRGNTWIKQSEIGKKHKVYGLVLCAQKRTPSTSALILLYMRMLLNLRIMMQLRSILVVMTKPLIPNVLRVACKLASDLVHTVKELLLNSITRKKNSDHRRCKSSGKKDQRSRNSQKLTKEKSCISDTFHKLSLNPKEKKQFSDDVTNIHSEHANKKMKNDVNMERETLSPIGVISLFDGVSSVLPIVSDILGRQPTIFVGAENDQSLRHLVAEKHGFRLDGKWKKHPSGMCSIYLDDVKKLFPIIVSFSVKSLASLALNVSGFLLRGRLAKTSHLQASLVDYWAFVDHNLLSSFMSILPSGISKRIIPRDMSGS